MTTASRTPAEPPASLRDRLRTEPVDTINHELRTPLTALLGHTELLQDLDLPAAAEQSIAAIARAGEQLLRLAASFSQAVDLDRRSYDLPARDSGLPLSPGISHQMRPAHGNRQGQIGRPGSTTSPSVDQVPDRRTLLDQLAVTTRRLESEIASRARAEHEALLSEERLRMTMDIAGMGTWDWDIATDDVVWSDNVEEVHGFAPGSFDRRYESWLAVVHPEDQVRVGELVGLALRHGNGRYDTELRICRPDSQTRWLHARGQAYYDDDGSPTRMVGTVIDISERRWAEEELRRANCEAQRARAVAEAASAAKNAFLSRMSHELRTPLNAVLGFAQLLELDVVGDQRESVKHIRKAGHHLLDLINEVQDIARIESGQLSLSPEPVLVAEVVEEVIHIIRPLADVPGLSVPQGSDGGFDRHVVADRQRLKQVLLNLLSNAVKYNRPGGSITIACAQAPEPETSTSISVRDSGFGIPRDDSTGCSCPSTGWARRTARWKALASAWS
jgi:PAS domain S-box-containing protein